MRIIHADSVNHALHDGAMHLARFGVPGDSRNGPVLVSPYPVVTVYNRPERRVLVCAERDANPFFHLFESIWMLAGRNDVAFPAKFVGAMKQYSDDDETLHGAYGHRWRNHFGYDQLQMLIAELRANPETRRAVLSMWDGNHRSDASDLHVAANGGKDVPCNTHAYFDTLGGKLNMTVLCRSNDIIFGAYGANAVHFSILLEFVAAAVGLPMGVYRQFSNNFHAYTDLYTRLFDEVGPTALARLAKASSSSDIYLNGSVKEITPLLQPEESATQFLMDCEAFCHHVIAETVTGQKFASEFFNYVVLPMFETWAAWKNKDYSEAKHLSLQIRADDWRIGAQEWLAIREARRNEEK